MSLINAFNNVLDDFLSDLLRAFPNEQYLKTFYSGFLLLKQANPSQIVINFMTYVGPHADKIHNCDTDFFLDFSNNINLENESYISKGLRIKHLWLHPDTTDHTKACIISYMQNLLKIGEKCLD